MSWWGDVAKRLQNPGSAVLGGHGAGGAHSLAGALIPVFRVQEA